MKSKFKIFSCLIALVTMTAFTAVAQSYPPVQVSPDNGIALPNDSQLVEKYELDFSEYNWTEQIAQDAATYLDDQSEYLEIEVDYPNSRLIFTLDLDNPNTANWNLINWEKHLAKIK